MKGAEQPLTASTLLRRAEVTLSEAGLATARLDAEVLLAAVLKTDRAGLYRNLGNEVGSDARTEFDGIVQRRVGLEPVAYITGRKEFWSLEFMVTTDVLVPRPETEHLVEAACRVLARYERPRVCDVGTGSGCIAVALATHAPDATLVGIDCSSAALAVARANALRHDVGSRMHLVAGDLLSSLGPAAQFDLIVSNPPYLTTAEAAAPALAREPRHALAAGHDGLAVIRRLLRTASAQLAAGGTLLMELGAGQKDAVADLATAAGFVVVTFENDLAAIPRVLVASR